jgi:hypothetical protein
MLINAQRKICCQYNRPKFHGRVPDVVPGHGHSALQRQRGHHRLQRDFQHRGDFDFTGSSTFNSSNAVWFSSFGSALVSTNAVAITTPLTAVRLNVTAGSSTATTTMTAVQAG